MAKSSRSSDSWRSRANACPPPYPTGGHKHKDYYFEKGNLVIQVEQTLFKVWDVSFHLQSKTFLDAFDVTEGLGDETSPLVLSGIECGDFEKLLWIIYPPVIGEYKATAMEDWVSVLKLSTLWDFTTTSRPSIN